MSPARPPLSAQDILAALNRRGVRYVVIGAFAAIAQGAPIDATYDIDVTPQRGRRIWNACRWRCLISMLRSESTISTKASPSPMTPPPWPEWKCST